MDFIYGLLLSGAIAGGVYGFYYLAYLACLWAATPPHNWTKYLWP